CVGNSRSFVLLYDV
uniref:Uncharacterized protein n=1 Tax=Solanum lycopersicum TaxID=4081 RepID=A0A3Q7IWQ0_SOLLC